MKGQASQYIFSTAKMTARCSAIAPPEETISSPSASEVGNFVINLSHEVSKGQRKLNAIAATTNIVAATSAGFTNLLADRVEHAAADFCFDERCNSQ